MTQSFARPTSAPNALIATIAMFALLVGLAPRPARADPASTTATLLGAAAAVAAIAISNNVRNKQANAPVGRTQDGGTILANGRVVYPNGDVLYTGNGNGQQCTFTGFGIPCSTNPTVYYPRGYNGTRHDNGLHKGWYKHHHHHDNDDDQGNNGYYNGNGHGHGHDE